MTKSAPLTRPAKNTGQNIEYPRIVVVENDKLIAHLLKWRLSTLGYNVAGVAANGSDALDLAKKLKPNLLMTEISLPGSIDGIETARILKTQYGIPSIFVTSLSDKQTLQRAKATKPQGYILKPFKDTDLRVAIELGRTQ